MQKEKSMTIGLDMSGTSGKAITTKLSYFEVGRVIAIVAVILLHSSAQVLFEFEPVFDYRWWIGNVIACGTHWAVPFFFMLSGALHLGKAINVKKFYLKKIKRIFVPLIIWIGIYAVIHHLYRSDPLRLSYIFERIIRDQPYEHLYFLFILFELFLITPILNKILSQHKTKYIFWTITILLTFFLNPGRWIFSIWIPFVSYYLAGYFLHQSTSVWKTKTLLLLLIGSLILSLIGTALLTRQIIPNKDGFYFFSYASPLTFIITLCFFQLCKQHADRINSKKYFIPVLASATYGVFLIHPMMILIFQHLATLMGMTIEHTAVYVLSTFLYSTIGSFLFVLFGKELYYKLRR